MFTHETTLPLNFDDERSGVTESKIILSVLVERPRIRTVIINGDTTRLSFPWVTLIEHRMEKRWADRVHVGVLGNLYALVSAERPSRSTAFYMPPLPNVRDDGVCLILPKEHGEFANLFWNSGFRYGDYYQGIFPGVREPLGEWTCASAAPDANPSDFPWEMWDVTAAGPSFRLSGRTPGLISVISLVAQSVPSSTVEEVLSWLDK